ncbi:hypothetical protein OC844_006988, partial [Tilletia horrida]
MASSAPPSRQTFASAAHLLPQPVPLRTRKRGVRQAGSSAERRKRQLSDGLAAHRLFVNTAAERYQAEINELRTENKLLRGQARSTGDDVRRRAAEYDTLRAVDIVR